VVETTLGYDARTQGFNWLKTYFLSFCKSAGSNSSTLKVPARKLKPLIASHAVVHSQRVQHALDIFNTAGIYGNKFINTSQSIHRMISGPGDVVPCITPSGAYWSMRHNRYVTGLVCKQHVFTLHVLKKKMKPEVTACLGPEHNQESKNSYVNHSPYMS
jgi:hypothetical protein